MSLLAVPEGLRVGSTATIAVSADQLKWHLRQDLVQEFQRPSGYGSSFCRVCGSPCSRCQSVAHAVRRAGRSAGRLPGAKVVEHIYVGSKASWEIIGDEAPQYEENGPPR